MPVNAIELRPRNAIVLFDAAIRVCATSTGVWALTLPSGAALIAALFHLADAIVNRRSLVAPVALWTLAWALRAGSQGAACHYLEQQIVGGAPPTARGSLRAALARAPGLVTGSAVMATLNVAIALSTGGLGFLFLGAHAAGYAAIMRGTGSALNVYGTASKLLGPTRTTAIWVRWCGLSQLLLAINVHAAVALALYLTRAVFGFDVIFFERFASLDNGVWVASVAVTTFALFEPLRAATGTLLLIDGRVRQEGLDLLAAVEQLPQRRKKLAPLVASGLAALALPCLLWPSAAQAGDLLTARLATAVERCSMQTVSQARVTGLSVDEGDRSALSRFVEHVERLVDDDDCEAAEATLREGLALMPDASGPQAGDPVELAKQALARPEFAQPPEPETETEGEPSDSFFGRLWERFWKALWDWLRSLRADTRETPLDPHAPGGSEMIGANAVMVVVIAVVVAVIIALLVLSRRKTDEPEGALGMGLDEQPLSDDPASALSKPPERWAGLADELAARGDFREAIRHLYLALLARLHRDGVIDYDPTNSNWDYLLAFTGAAELRRGFRELTRRFDFAWYGQVDVTDTAWAAFRSTAEPLLSTTRERDDRA